MRLKENWPEVGLTVVCLFLIAAPAYANMGSMLVYAAYSHVLFLNFIIALVEAIAAVLLLRIRAFRVRWLGQLEAANTGSEKQNDQPSALGVRKAYFPLLLANITSVIIGYIILVLLSGYDPSRIPFGNLRFVLPGFILVTWFLTILIEWPFVKPLVRNTKLNFARPVLAALVLCGAVNTVSYIGLFMLYDSSGDTSLITQAKYDSTASFLKNKPGRVYYVDEETDCICRMNLDGTEKVMQNRIAGRLMVAPSKKPGFWDLKSSDGKMILSEFSQKTTDMGYPFLNTKHSLEKIPAGNNWHIRELRSEKTGRYDVEKRDGMAFSGMVAIDKLTGKRQSIGLETLFSVGMTGDVNLLPDDIMIWALGNRILAYDLKSKRVSQLARGSSPVVTLDM